jgi:hypothetical protein
MLNVVMTPMEKAASDALFNAVALSGVDVTVTFTKVDQIPVLEWVVGAAMSMEVFDRYERGSGDRSPRIWLKNDSAIIFKTEFDKPVKP